MPSKRKTPQKNNILDLVKNRIAEFRSLYPETTTLTFSCPRPRSAREAMAVVGAIFLVTDTSYWESEQIIKSISQRCYIHQYQGEWSRVQEILEHCTNFSEYKEYILSSIMSTCDYYGNLERKIGNWVRLLQPHPEGTQYGPVKKKVRRRGYNDKGTLRPNHTKGRDVGLLTDDRVDRRDRVAHPLLRKEDEKTYFRRIAWIATSA